ncbi:MAG: hypothetical protein SGJ20_11835 [Planctomycetota bacterium]|nr:hypothetical protein [Planctomycetota bacterium]
MQQHNCRRGVSVVQMTVVLAGIGIAVVLGTSVMSSSANSSLEQTASEVGDPTKLTGRFGYGYVDSGSSTNPAAAGYTGDSSSSGGGSSSEGGGDAGGSSSGGSSSGGGGLCG